MLPWVAFGVETDSGTGVAGKINEGIQSFLWTFVNLVFGWLVWMGGMLLDEGISTYVVGFGEQFKVTGLGFAVDSLWVMVRDFFNLFFIFGLVYIGFKMILNSGDSSARHMLVSIIMAALLVNFSLFFTKFIVDFSNIVATQIAQGFTTAAGDYEVSTAFMQVLGITGLFNTGGAEGLNAIHEGGGYSYIIGSMILYIVLGFVLAVGGFLLIIRFVVLNIYMILSPIMFLGWVFPGMANLSKTYWSNFLKRAFFAPAYLLMLYFAYFVINEFTALTQQKPFADLFENADKAADSFSTTIPFFIITCTFLIAAIIVAQKMGAEGANFSASLGRRMVGGTTKAFRNTAVSAVRHTGGQIASRAGRSQRLRNIGANSWLGEKAHRGIVAAGGGYDKQVDAKSKADLKYAESLGETAVKDAKGNYVNEEMEERIKGIVNANPRLKAADEAAKASQQQLTTKNDELAEAIKTETLSLDKLNDQLEKAESPSEKMGYEDEITKTEASIQNIKDGYQSEINTLEKVSKESTNELKEAKVEALEEAEANITYEKQLRFIERREQETDFFPNFKEGTWGKGAKVAAISGGTATASAGGVVVAGAMTAPAALVIGGAGLLAGGVVKGSFNEESRRSALGMRKVFGKGGVEKVKRNKKMKEAKIFGEAYESITGEPLDTTKRTPPTDTQDKAA